MESRILLLAKRQHVGLWPDMATKTILNLGSGEKRIEGAVNVDITPRTGPDVVHDLNRMPWPFDDGQFDEVMAADVLEHSDDGVAVMEEVHRVSRHGARFQITTPHFSCSNSYTDPTHRHHFSRFSLDYFTGEHELSFYTDVRYRCLEASIIFYPSLLNKVVHRWANRYPAAYERRWAWVFPAWFLYFELEIVKGHSGESAALGDNGVI